MQALSKARRQRLFPAAVLPAVMLVYAATLVVMPSGGFWINDNGCKFLQMTGLVQNGYRDVSIPWPGRDIDPAYLFNPLPSPFGELFRGRLYGFYSHPFTLVSSIPYRLLGFRGIYVIPLVSAFFLLLAVRSLADRLPGRPRSLAVGIVGLCTPVWFYGVDFWEHLPACCLVAWSVVAILRFHARPTSRSVALCAFFLGTAIYFRDDLYLFGLPLLAAVALMRPFRWPHVALFGATAALTLAPLWAFNLIQFHHPLGLRLLSAASGSGGVLRHLADRPKVFDLLLLNGHGKAALSLIATLPFAFLLFVPFAVGTRWREPAMLALAVLGLASGTIIASGHLLADRPMWWLMQANGLFAASPVVVFALIRVGKQGASGPSDSGARLIRLIAAAYAGIYVLLSPLANTAGIHWGCRLLLPLYPLLGVLSASAISVWWAESPGRNLAGVLAATVIALSFGVQAYAQKLQYERKSFSAELNRLVAERPEDVVAAVGWFLPQEIATVFYDKKVFLVKREDQLGYLLAFLRRHGVRDVLVVSAEPLRAGSSPATCLLTDVLNFISVRLVPLRLTP
ncbi:hypothetical protein JXA88_16935 [Candidatus Fermentibacteria bacterium]|nr:hypothetical protein [Candidatus Fermentibacteria bacterium]